MTQLRQRHALTKRNLFLFFISSVGIFSFYEKCKGQIKKRRSQRLYSDVLKELTEEDRRLLGEALGVEEESRG